MVLCVAEVCKRDWGLGSPPCSLSFSSLMILPIIFIYIYIYILIPLTSTTLPHVHDFSPLDFFLFYSVPSSRRTRTFPPSPTSLYFSSFSYFHWTETSTTPPSFSYFHWTETSPNPDLRTAATTQPNPLFFFLIFNASITTSILYKSQCSKEQQGCTTKEQWHEENRGDR